MFTREQVLALPPNHPIRRAFVVAETRAVVQLPDMDAARVVLARGEPSSGLGARVGPLPASRLRCRRLHAHPNKVEGRVCDSFFAWLEEQNLTRDPKLVGYVRPRIPLFKIPADDEGAPHYVSPDFLAATSTGTIVRIVDAKGQKPGGKRWRDPAWRRGRAMLHAEFGIPVEEKSS